MHQNNIKTKDEQLKEVSEKEAIEYGSKFTKVFKQVLNRWLVHFKAGYIKGVKSEIAKVYHSKSVDVEELREKFFNFWKNDFNNDLVEDNVFLLFDWFIPHLQSTNIIDTDKWIDMDASPKDGTEILVYDEELGVKQCAWLDDTIGGRNKRKRDFKWCVVGSWQDEQGGHFTIDNPIKWQPLPKEPLKK